MTYEMALAYLAGLKESRIRPGLERIERVLSFLGSPHLDFPHVLIGGTNGKGSVVAFMGSVLEKAGFKVGRFTSPHLHKFEERIVVNGDPVSPTQMVGMMEAVKVLDVDLSYFELATAMALLYFQRSNVDIALLEVGLGGRWDATNATDPQLSIIASVDRDHQEWLGDSIEKITLEKSMIMRPERPFIVNSDCREALDVMTERSRSLRSHLILSGRDFSARWEVPEETLHFVGSRWSLSGLRLGLKGRYQRENAATSLVALEYLDRSGFQIPEFAVIQGMAEARWPGRFDDMGGDPRVIVDSAHNRGAARALVKSLDTGCDVVWLFSCLEDKDLVGMVEEMLAFGNRFVLVPLDHARACDLDDMYRRMPETARVIKASSVKKGLIKAVDEAGKGGTVVVAGSIFLAAEVLEQIKKVNSE